MKCLSLMGLVLVAASAWAGSQSFDWLVDPVPELPAGSVDTRLIQSFVPKGHGPRDDGGVATEDLTRTAIRTMYGLTDHVALMYQLNVARPNAQSYDYEGSEFGVHLRLFEGEGWKVGGAVELEWQRSPQYVDDALDIDVHPIIERDFGPVSILVNPILAKNLVGPDAVRGVEAAYSAQLLYHFAERYAAGVEFYGEKGRLTDGGPVHSQDHYIMPVVNGSFGRLNLAVGPGFGLTSASDRVVLKFGAEYSFATSLFHAPDSSER
jgi:hypothetical protein